MENNINLTEFINEIVEKKEKRSDYLMGLVFKTLDEIDNKYKKYSRKHFIPYEELNNILFTFEEMEAQTSGYYLDVTKDKDLKFNHIIAISNKLLENNTLNPTNRCSKKQKALNNKIKNILKHEMCHYWVNENLDLKHFYYGDDSPIMIALSLYLNPYEMNGYKSFEEAESSKFTQSVMSLETLDEVEELLVKTVIRLNRIMRKYKKLPIKFEWESKHEYSALDYDLFSDCIIDICNFLSPYRYKVNTSKITIETLKDTVSEDFKTIIMQDLINEEGLTLEEAQIKYEQKTKEFNEIIEDFENGKNATYQHRIVLSREINDLDDLERQIDFLAKEIEVDLNEEYKFLNKNNIKGGMSNEI